MSKSTAAIILAAILITAQCSAFSLLGPYEPWMTSSLGYQYPGDIGGPMDLKAGYRWNMPNITYGFDQSFLNYFGTNGVAAVESAVAILNALPPASSINFADYPLSSTRLNFQAQSQGLIDLKSITLSLLLEQMGLTSPYHGFALRNVIPNGANTPVSTVLVRNFDPLTLYPTNSINDILYAYYVTPSSTASTQFSLGVVQSDPLAPPNSAVVGRTPMPGEFYTGLTRDDAGGLRFLLSAGNTNVETMPPGVAGLALDSDVFVNTAIRLGMEKITFSEFPHPLPDGSLQVVLFQWTDTYIVNGVTNQQILQRSAVGPDILFTMANIYLFDRTGPTNWVNNASLNANQTGAGPGVIQPGAIIRFGRIGSVFDAQPGFLSSDFSRWGSYDGSSALPKQYPLSSTIPGNTQVQLRLIDYAPSNYYTMVTNVWTLPPQPGPDFQFQTSTDLINWANVTNFPNNGLFNWCTYFSIPGEASRFFRLTPAPSQ